MATGPVVDFRLKEHLKRQPLDAKEAHLAPLIYPYHMKDGRVNYTITHSKKANAIAITPETQQWLYPRGNYVLVKRLTSKEEVRRLVATVFLNNYAQADELSTDWVGFENHLNVLYFKNQELDSVMAKGLAVYLNSTFADQWFRRFSGSTQVNASDLRAIGYPNAATLHSWGSKVGDEMPSQAIIDDLLKQNIL